MLFAGLGFDWLGGGRGSRSQPSHSCPPAMPHAAAASSCTSALPFSVGRLTALPDLVLQIEESACVQLRCLPFVKVPPSKRTTPVCQLPGGRNDHAWHGAQRSGPSDSGTLFPPNTFCAVCVRRDPSGR